MTKLWIKTCDSVKIILYLNQYFDSKKRDDYTRIEYGLKRRN